MSGLPYCFLCERQLAPGRPGTDDSSALAAAGDGIRLPVVLGVLWWLAVIGGVVALVVEVAS